MTSDTNPEDDIPESFDPEDLLSDSLQTLYDYTPITHSSAGSLFRYTLRTRPAATADHTILHASADPIKEEVVTLVTPNTQAGNWALHASSIWTSAIYVADHVENLRIHEHVRAIQTRGESSLRVLELGAGAGLPSIVIAKSYRDVAVTASDYPDEQLIATLEVNVRRNDVLSRCRVVPYAWGSDPSVFSSPSSEQDSAEFDVVIAADTLWNRDLHVLFLKTLQQVLRRTTDARIYLVAGLHTGRYTLQAFMNVMEDYGLIVDNLVEREVNGALSRVWDVGWAEGEDEKERRRWVVDMTLKWKNI